MLLEFLAFANRIAGLKHIDERRTGFQDMIVELPHSAERPVPALPVLDCALEHIGELVAEQESAKYGQNVERG